MATNLASASLASAASSAAAASSGPLQDQFNNFLDNILRVFTIDEGIRREIRETMQKLNVPDKIQFMANEQLQAALVEIDELIQKEYDKIKEYINEAIWIDFLKNIIQLQVLVFLKKIPLDALIGPFEKLLNQKVSTLVDAKRQSGVANKYLKYKKKYLELK